MQMIMKLVYTLWVKPRNTFLVLFFFMYGLSYIILQTSRREIFLSFKKKRD